MKNKSLAGRRVAWLVAFLSLPGQVLAEVVVVTGSKNPVGTIAREQVSDIYLGKASSFPGGAAAIPLDQPEASPLREDFYSKVTGKSASQAKSHWAKLSFTGKGTPPKEGQNSADIKKQLAANPSLVGYIDKSEVDASVKVIFSVQ